MILLEDSCTYRTLKLMIYPKQVTDILPGCWDWRNGLVGSLTNPRAGGEAYVDRGPAKVPTKRLGRDSST
jgi:hypothetical protein